MQSLVNYTFIANNDVGIFNFISFNFVLRIGWLFYKNNIQKKRGNSSSAR